MKPFFDVTYAPGPGQLSDEVRADIAQAPALRVTDISHRGPEFTVLSKKAVEGLREFFNIPSEYEILFSSSATDVWTIATHNLIENAAFHFVNGNFSGAFARTVKGFGKKQYIDEVEWGTQNDFTAAIPPDADLVTVCFNETSTGVMASNADIAGLKATHPDKILAVDLTSIAGVWDFNIKDADLWYFSVQKAMGLPAGLSVMIVSPQAMEKAKKLGEKQPIGYFNLPAMQAKMAGKYQTLPTPNILNIYLLGQQLERWNSAGGVARQQKQSAARADALYKMFTDHPTAKPFVQNPAHRSISSVCIEADEATVKRWHASAEAANTRLGGGYGPLKPTCIRLATFPGISDEEFEKLLGMLK